MLTHMRSWSTKAAIGVAFGLCCSVGGCSCSESTEQTIDDVETTIEGITGAQAVRKGEEMKSQLKDIGRQQNERAEEFLKQQQNP